MEENKPKKQWTPGRQPGAKNKPKTAIKLHEIPELLATGKIDADEAIKAATGSSRVVLTNSQVRAAIQADKIKKTAIAKKYRVKEIEKEFDGLTNAERLRITHADLVRRLTFESHRNFISDIDWDDAESVRIRNTQLSNLKSLLSVVNAMSELIDRLEKLGGHNSITSAEDKAEAADILASAQKLLYKAEPTKFRVVG